MPKIIVLSLFGMAALAVALVATNRGSRAVEDLESRGTRIAARGGAPLAQLQRPPSRPAAATSARRKAERIGLAEKMFPDGLVKDFGAVPHRTRLLHRFPIVNNQAAPIEIAYLQPSCDCTTATAPRRILQPGESTTIDVGLDMRDYTGSFEETVRVKVVGPDFESTCKLMVRATGQDDTHNLQRGQK